MTILMGFLNRGETKNERIIFNSWILFLIPVCKIRSYNGRFNSSLFLAFWCDFGSQTFFFHRGRSFSRRFWSGSDSFRLKISNNTFFVLPVTVICAILILKTGRNRKINGDAAIAMVSVGSLAIGYLLMNLFSVSTNLSGDVCSTLFGSASILTLSESDVWFSAVLSVIVIFLFVIFYNRIFSVTFDENFAVATGIHAGAYNLFISVTIAVIIVAAMNLVGSLLISALIVFPALSAMRLFKTFRSVTVASSVISVFCAFFGIVVSVLIGTPVGATIVVFDIAIFVILSVAGFFLKRAKS